MRHSTDTNREQFEVKFKGKFLGKIILRSKESKKLIEILSYNNQPFKYQLGKDEKAINFVRYTRLHVNKNESRYKLAHCGR